MRTKKLTEGQILSINLDAKLGKCEILKFSLDYFFNKKKPISEIENDIIRHYGSWDSRSEIPFPKAQTSEYFEFTPCMHPNERVILHEVGNYIDVYLIRKESTDANRCFTLLNL